MASTTAVGLTRKLKKVLEMRMDAPDVLTSLSALSSLCNEDQDLAETRKNLRTSMERRMLSINGEYLHAAESAQQALKEIETEVRGLVESCDKISASLRLCSASTGDMVTASERLRQDVTGTRQKHKLVASFLHHYQLSKDEVAVLRGEGLDSRFFDALARVQTIHASCKTLLRTHHQRAALELMDLMAMYQEGAYEKLCRWVQSELRQLSDSETPEASDLLRRATHCLRARPVLFRYCAEEIAGTRHNALFRRFIAALTRGGPGGMPRPIEVHAHDPMRYVSDMLAWLHQAVASERELCTSLFGSSDLPSPSSTSPALPSPNENDPSAAVASDADVMAVLDRVFEGVCRPFKVRVEQVLMSQPNLVLAYRLSTLLAFYNHTLADLVGASASLPVAIHELQAMAEAVFREAFKARGDRLLRFPPEIPPDLSAPAMVSEAVAVLVELLVAHQAMMVPPGAERPDFLPVIAGLLDPVVAACTRAAEDMASTPSSSSLDAPRRFSASVSRSSSGLSQQEAGGTGGGSSGRRSLPSMSSQGDDAHSTKVRQVSCHVFLVNCLSSLHHSLIPYDAALSYASMLFDLISSHVTAMVQLEVTDLLAHCLLASKLHAIATSAASSGEGRPPLSQLPELSPAAVSESLRLLFALLAGMEGHMPEFAEVAVPRLRRQACEMVAVAVWEAYSTLHGAVMDAKNGYADPQAMLRHSPEDMKTILGLGASS